MKTQTVISVGTIFGYLIALIAPTSGQTPTPSDAYVCRAETERVYLHPQPQPSIVNAQITLVNGTAVQIFSYNRFTESGNSYPQRQSNYQGFQHFVHFTNIEPHYNNGFIFVQTQDGMKGWVPRQYICQTARLTVNSPGYVCGAETGRVYLRPQPQPSSMNARITLVNGIPVQISSYNSGFIFVETEDGMKGWVTRQYICRHSPQPNLFIRGRI